MGYSNSSDVHLITKKVPWQAPSSIVVSFKPEKALMKLYEYVLLWGGQFYALFIWLEQNDENVWFAMMLISFPDVLVIVSKANFYFSMGRMNISESIFL